MQKKRWKEKWVGKKEVRKERKKDGRQKRRKEGREK